MALLRIASVNGHAFIALSSEWIKQFVKVFSSSSQFSVWKLTKNRRRELLKFSKDFIERHRISSKRKGCKMWFQNSEEKKTFSQQNPP